MCHLFNSDTVEEVTSAETRQTSAAEESYSALSTRILEEREAPSPPGSSVQRPQILLEDKEPVHTGGCTLKS